MKNYYKILGVSRTASSESIKRAYRSKAKDFHPDVYNDKSSKEQFQLINEAYQVLKDDKKRRLYDYRLKQGFNRPRVYNQPRKNPYYYSSYAQRAYYAYRKADSASKNYKYYEKIFDNILFTFMALAGIYAVGFGFYRLFYDQVDGVNPLTGIIVGVIFTFVIIFGWIARKR